MKEIADKGRLAPDAILLLVAIVAGLGTLRLTTTPGDASLVLSILGVVTAGHLSVSAVERALGRRRAKWPAVASGIVSVALVTAWISVPFATRFGIPTLTTVRALVHRFDEAGGVIRSHPTPLAATPAVVLCLVAGVGLAAVVSRALWGWVQSESRRSASALVALIPTFGLFAYCCVLSSGRYRVPSVIGYLVSAGLFLVVADSPNAGGRSASSLLRTGTLAGLSSGALAVVVVLGLSPALSGMKLDALPFSGKATLSPSGPGPSSGGPGTQTRSGRSKRAQPLETLSLIDNLQGVLTARSDEVMFNARTSVPTYWQLATLTSFNGTQWVTDAGTAAVIGPAPGATLEQVPPVLPEPPAVSTYEASVSLVGFTGNLLPVPPTAVSISGAGSTLDPAIGALYNSVPTSRVQRNRSVSYKTLARTPSSVFPSSAGAGVGSDSVSSGDLAPYLALPASVPGGVVALAQQVTSGVTGDAAKAEAIARWFNSSGGFRYTVDARAIPGLDPLSSFLFVTRAGFCQQFAGAFAVLARLSGLPTRLAVGFATGTPVGGGTQKNGGISNITYRVTGADAHVWPEVYLGPSNGWVSFEPTPPASAEPNGAGVLGIGAPVLPGSATSTTPTTKAPQAITPTPRHPAAPRQAGASAWVVLAVALLGACVIGIVAAIVILVGPSSLPRRMKRARQRRRLRKLASRSKRRIRGATPDLLVIARMDRASRSLSRAGIGRLETETLFEHVERLRARGTSDELASAFTAYESLIKLAERATYSAEKCSEEEANEALRLCNSVCSSLRSGI